MPPQTTAPTRVAGSSSAGLRERLRHAAGDDHDEARRVSGGCASGGCATPPPHDGRASGGCKDFLRADGKWLTCFCSWCWYSGSEEEAGPVQDEAAGAGDAPEQQEVVGDSDAPEQPEDAGEAEESILGNLSPISDDASTMDTEEYNRLTKELEDEEAAEAESAPPKQVLATLAALDQQEEEDENSQSDPQPSHAGSPLSRERPCKEVLSPEELVEHAGMDAIAHSEILNKPITPDDAADPEALEAKRQEMLATTNKFATTAAAMLDERKEAAHFLDNFLKRERQVDESMEKFKQLRKHWEDKVTELQQEADKIRREAIPPRKITFATPTEQQPFSTPKDNLKKAAEILKKKDEQIDIDYDELESGVVGP
nr:uncharacterized protein LOC127347329 [Lolium perenne]